MEETAKREREWEGPDGWPEAKRLRDADFTFLSIFEDGDAASPDPAAGDIETVMKSLEEEIAVPLPSPPPPPPRQPAENETTPPPATSISNYEETGQLDLCYLLEASDDDLGLPPTSLPSSDRGEAALGGLAEDGDQAIPGMGQISCGFADEIPTSDGALGVDGLGQQDEDAGGGALFDLDDVAASWPSDLFDCSGRHEYLSAV